MKKEDYERACDIKMEEAQLVSQLRSIESIGEFEIKLSEMNPGLHSSFFVFCTNTDDLAKEFVEAVKNRLRGQIEELEKEFAEL